MDVDETTDTTDRKPTLVDSTAHSRQKTHRCSSLVVRRVPVWSPESDDLEDDDSDGAAVSAVAGARNARWSTGFDRVTDTACSHHQTLDGDTSLQGSSDYGAASAILSAYRNMVCRHNTNNNNNNHQQQQHNEPPQQQPQQAGTHARSGPLSVHQQPLLDEASRHTAGTQRANKENRATCTDNPYALLSTPFVRRPLRDNTTPRVPLSTLTEDERDTQQTPRVTGTAVAAGLRSHAQLTRSGASDSRLRQMYMSAATSVTPAPATGMRCGGAAGRLRNAGNSVPTLGNPSTAAAASVPHLSVRPSCSGVERSRVSAAVAVASVKVPDASAATTAAAVQTQSTDAYLQRRLRHASASTLPAGVSVMHDSGVATATADAPRAVSALYASSAPNAGAPLPSSNVTPAKPTATAVQENGWGGQLLHHHLPHDDCHQQQLFPTPPSDTSSLSCAGASCTTGRLIECGRPATRDLSACRTAACLAAPIAAVDAGTQTDACTLPPPPQPPPPPAPAESTALQLDTRVLESLCVNERRLALLAQIGCGGSSKVHRVLDSRLQSWALKVVRLDECDQATMNSFINEIQLLRKLQHSNRVVRLVDWEHKVGQHTLYIVMELGDTDLASLMRSYAKLNEVSANMCRFFWEEMLRCVDVIHREGIVHSDLKPSNFLLVAGRLKLIDFGIASQIQSECTSIIKDHQPGTFNYISPEAIKSQQVVCNGTKTSVIKISRRSDVWSLGCILYNFAYGHTPFSHIKQVMAKMMAIVNDDHHIEFSALSNPHLMNDLRSCLQRDPLKRPSIEQLLISRYLTS